MILMPNDLPPDWREWYEERAAIREYDGREPRAEAERNAFDEVLEAMKRAAK